MTQENKPSLFKVIISRDKLTASISALTQCDRLDKEEICKELLREGVKFGLQHSRIEVFSLYPSREPTIIAEGTPPILCKDGHLEVFFTHNPKQDFDFEGMVNFRETSTIISVEAGTRLATVHDPIYGSEGCSVTGEKIAPPKPRVITIKAGKGVKLSPDGKSAYAEVNGRPWIRDAGLTRIISCESVYVHNSDVDIKTGNLRFKGDVKINGNICEAMEVQVSGNVEVQGLATMARIISGKRIVIYGNVISCRLRAGVVFPGAKKLGFMFSDLNSELQSLANALEQLKEMKVIDFNVVDFGRVVLGLMDSRYKNIRPMVKNIQQFMGSKSREEMPEEIIQTVNALSVFSELKPINDEIFRNIQKCVNVSLDLLIQSNSQSEGSIVVRSALSSVMQSSGNVYVSGQGCVNTNITAGGHVVVKGSFKGGEILCEGNVDINELGSNLGAPPVVRVASGSTIKINKAYEGSVLQVGKRRITLTRELDSFKASLNKDDQLEIY